MPPPNCLSRFRARSSQVLHWIDAEEPDVICLQETKASPEQVPEPLASVAGYHVHWHGYKGYSGVALLLRTAKFGDAPVFVHPHFDLENRIVVAEVGNVVFGSVYVPNGGKDLAAKMTFLNGIGPLGASENGVAVSSRPSTGLSSLMARMPDEAR